MSDPIIFKKRDLMLGHLTTMAQFPSALKTLEKKLKIARNQGLIALLENDRRYLRMEYCRAKKWVFRRLLAGDLCAEEQPILAAFIAGRLLSGKGRKGEHPRDDAKFTALTKRFDDLKAEERGIKRKDYVGRALNRLKKEEEERLKEEDGESGEEFNQEWFLNRLRRGRRKRGQKRIIK